jgi:hypothetical protein
MEEQNGKSDHTFLAHSQISALPNKSGLDRIEDQAHF